MTNTNLVKQALLVSCPTCDASKNEACNLHKYKTTYAVAPTSQTIMPAHLDRISKAQSYMRHPSNWKEY